MLEFKLNREIYGQAKRGTYIIFPLKYDIHLDLKSLEIEEAQSVDFDSINFADLLVQKCKKENGFVRRYILNKKFPDIHFENGMILPIEEVQLIVFDNQIAFLDLLITYENNQWRDVYHFINPGYVDDKRDDLRKEVIASIKNIQAKEYGKIFELYVGSDELAIKETYLFNIGLVTRRFKNLKTAEQVAFNEHKIIDLSEDFEDSSEKDIAYTYGARDVEKKTYRWCVCISSQSISYVYAVENEGNIIEEAKDDLLLTMLVLHQKNTCMLLNEKMQNTLSDSKHKHYFKNVSNLKQEALKFRASGTLAPSQVSRWNNVCETYRNLIVVNGVNEALEEIEQKIELIKDELDRKSNEIQNYIATFIAVFGLISIVASVLTIVDLVGGGTNKIQAALEISCIGIAAFVVSWVVMMMKSGNRR